MSLDAFLKELLTAECGIDFERMAWYRANKHVACIRYPAVKSPGRLVRCAETGRPTYVHLTVAEYFDSLGVLEALSCQSETHFKEYQYRTVNPLGFVGFQIGEAALISTGYYKPERLQVLGPSGTITVSAYYQGGVPDSTWRCGTRTIVMLNNGSQPTAATDTNRWEGVFTGKDGVDCLQALMNEDRQKAVMHEIVRANLAHIEKHLAAGHARSFEMICKGYYSPELRCSLSGLMAYAHLCGPTGAIGYLENGTIAKDEFGTSGAEYLERFNNHSLCAADIHAA